MKTVGKLFQTSDLFDGLEHNNGVPCVATNLLADLATNALPSAEFTLFLPPDTNSLSPTDFTRRHQIVL